VQSTYRKSDSSLEKERELELTLTSCYWSISESNSMRIWESTLLL